MSNLNKNSNMNKNSNANQMSNFYTTGEMAKLCNVSVRTVQYYDTRNILIPSELSEGGRRLYSEEDLRKLKIICFLRNLDIPINSIGELLAEEKPENVISILLEQQEQILKEEISERQSKLLTLEELSKELKKVEHFSVESIGDIAYMMENKKKLRKLHQITLVVGIIMEIVETALLILWIAKGIWLPYVIGMILLLIMAGWLCMYYFKQVAYICPECHTVFVPNLKEAFFARHTATTRKLTCSSCGRKGFCVETYYDPTVNAKEEK